MTDRGVEQRTGWGAPSARRVRRVLLIALGLITLTACESQVDKAKREFEMAKKAGVVGSELCARTRAIDEAYLQNGDALNYRIQRVHSNVECQTAKFDEQSGIVRGPDGEEIVPDNLDAVDAAIQNGHRL